MTDYKWLAESIRITGDQIAADILAAIKHACTVPGAITAAQADRLSKLGAELSK